MIQDSACQGTRSYSLAKRRLATSQAKVRSTTQRRGWTTKPFVPSGRVTISRSRAGQCSATQMVRPLVWYALSAPTLRMVGTKARARSSTASAPTASGTPAEWTSATSSRPAVSTSRWRLRPFPFFSRVVAGLGCDGGALGALAVADGGGRRGVPPRARPVLRAQAVVEALARPVARPLDDIIVGRAPVGQVARERAPLAAGAQAVQQGVDHAAQVHRAATPRPRLRREECGDAPPLLIGHVALISRHPRPFQLYEARPPRSVARWRVFFRQTLR